MANELSALVRFAGGSLDDLVLTPAESLHRAIGDRVFGAIGPLAAPARFVHDGIARTVYAVLRGGAAASTGLAAASLRLATGDDFSILSRSRRGRAAISALNALAGDRLQEHGSEIAIEMAVWEKGADVPLSPARLRAAFPKARGRIAVFLHGLGETADAWQRRRVPFGTRLRRDFGITPVYVRYNTGLHISHNGRHLSDLLDDLLEGFPVRVDELVLIGHSMGGLVARSACHPGHSAGRSWPAKLKHLITLGAPHTGVPLEKVVHAASWMLGRVPESRPLANVLDRRSAGIRDLRFGYLVEDDWRGELAGRLLHDHRTHVPPLEGCTHTFISASLAGNPRNALSRIAGDLLVRSDSASGRRHDGSIAVSSDHIFQLASLTHFDLLDHPAVYRSIRRVIAG